MTPDVYVWAIASGCVAGLLLISVMVWLAVFLVRRKKVGKKSGGHGDKPPLLGHEPWVRKSILTKSLAGAALAGRDKLEPAEWTSAPSLLTPQSFNVHTSNLTSAEPVQPPGKPGIVRWNSFCSPTAEGLVGNLFPRSCSYGRNGRLHSYSFCLPPYAHEPLFMCVTLPPSQGPCRYSGEKCGTGACYACSDDEEEERTAPGTTNGRVWFSLTFKEESKELDVKIIKAKYIPGRGLTNAPRDPFVRAYLLPDEDNFQQTGVKRRTLAPKFDETVTFKVGDTDVRRRTLRLSVYDIDRRKVRHCLGHITLNLEKETLVPDRIIWMDLDIVPKKSSQIGEIQVCLTCNPFTNRIKAAALRVRRFSRSEEKSTSAYVKFTLNHGRKSVKEKRTETKEWAVNDEVAFIDSFTFGIAGRYFDSCSLTFTVMVSSDAANFVRLGKTVLGPFMYARGEELRHWQDMLTNPRSPVTRWHALECPTGRAEWKSD